MAKPALNCPGCGIELAVIDPIPRAAQCPGCREDIHACTMCRFHNARAHNQCDESRSEWQSRRDRANFCDFFELAVQKGDVGPVDTGDAARKRTLDDLFRNF